MSSCANHACSHKLDEDEHITCSLCRTPMYCSEECRVIDWAAHNCANRYELNDLSDAVFVPYHYEDMLPSDEFDKLDVNDPAFSSYSLRHVSANGVVSHRIESSYIGDEALSFAHGGEFMGRGDTPPADMTGKRFTIRIMYGPTGQDGPLPMIGSPISGVIPDDMIYLENKTNPAAAKLSGKGFSGLFASGGLGRRFRKLSGKLVFWPAPRAVEGAGIFVPIAGGRIWVDLQVDGVSSPVEVHGVYRLKNSRETSALSRSVSKLFQLQLKTKFGKSGDKGIQVSPKDVQVLLATDLRGNRVALSFLVNPDETMAQLIDVEFMVGKDKLRESGTPTQAEIAEHFESISFSCSPKDVNQLHGLCMAIDQQIKEAPGADSQLEKCAAVIRKYALNKEGSITEVDTAIRYALDTQFNQIGLAMQATFRKRLAQHGNDPKIAEEAAEKIITSLKKGRAGSQKNPLNKLRKSKARSDARDLIAVISPFTISDNMSEEARGRFQAVINKLNKALMERD